MPPDIQAETAKWLRYSQQDLAAAELTLESKTIAPRHSCFHAQQAAEKAIKAIFVFLQIQFPFSHDLEELNARLPEGWGSTLKNLGLETLTQWAVEARYPIEEEPDVEDANYAVDLARKVLENVREDLLRHGFTESA